MKKIRRFWNHVIVAHIIIDGFCLLSAIGQWLWEKAGAAASAAHKLFWNPVE